MTYYYRTQAFVFKYEDRLEADRIFSVFTKDFGKMEIFGKAIRKIASKLRGGMNIFSLADIEFVEGKNRKTLIDAISLQRFPALSKNPEKLRLAFSISKTIESFMKGQEKDERSFGLIHETFEKLNNEKLKNIQIIYYYFFWNFMSILGYEPELSRCAVCGQKLNPYILYFSNKEGGIICKSCSFSKRDGIKIKSDIVKIIRLILQKNWNILPKLKIEPSTQKSLQEISNNYYNYLYDAK